MTISNNFQRLSYTLLVNGYWLNPSDEARAYTNEHLPSLNNGYALPQEHSDYIITNFCTPLLNVEAMQYVIDMDIDFNLDLFPVGTVVRVESDTDEETYSFKRVHADWFMKLDEVQASEVA